MKIDVIQAVIAYPKALLLVLAAVTSLLWVSYSVFWQRRFHQKLYKIYTLYAIASILWILANAYFQSPLLHFIGPKWATQMALFANIFSGCSFVFAFYLACSLQHVKKVALWQQSIIIFILLETFAVNLIPGLTVIDTKITGPTEFELIQSNFTPMFFSQGLILAILTLAIFWQINKKASKVKKVKSRYMMLGITCVLISIVIFDIFIPFFFSSYSWVWLPPLFTITEVLLFGYALLCQRFPSLKITLQQVLTYGINSAFYGLPMLGWLHYYPVGSASNTVGLSVLVLLTSVYWSTTQHRINRGCNRLLYRKDTNPVEDIRATQAHFQHSITQGLDQLAQALHVRQARLALASDSQYAPVSQYFATEQAADLVRDEVHYLANQPFGATQQAAAPWSRLQQHLDAYSLSLVLPVFNPERQLIGLLLFHRPQPDKLFFRQELQALQAVLAHAQPVLQAAVCNQYAGQVLQAMAPPWQQLQVVLYCLEQALPSLPNPQPGLTNLQLRFIQQLLQQGTQLIAQIEQHLTAIDALAAGQVPAMIALDSAPLRIKQSITTGADDGTITDSSNRSY